MAENNTNIKFYRCTAAQWASYDKQSSTGHIFFVGENHKLYITNGTATPEEYGVENSIVNVAMEGSELIFTYAWGAAARVNIGVDAEALAAINALKDYVKDGKLEFNYVPTVDPNLATLNDLGGIKAGTTASTLSGKSFSEMFDDLLFPTVQPTATVNSVTLSLKNGLATTREVGSTAPVAGDFNVTTSVGSWNINNKYKQPYAGAVIEGSKIIYAGTKTNGMPAKVAENSTNYFAEAEFAEGPEPLDSKGQAAKGVTKYTGGTKKSNAVTITGVYPFYANKTSNTAFNKLPLTTSTSFEVTLPAEGPNKHAFKLPKKYTLQNVELLNTLSGKYEAFGVSKFTKTSETIDVNGADVEYSVYTRNDSGFSGEGQFKISYSK